MQSRFSILILLLLLGLVAWGRTPTAPEGAFTDELDSDHYNIDLTLTAQPGIKDADAVLLPLEWASPKQFVLLTITRGKFAIAHGRNKRAPLAVGPLSVTTGTPYRLTVMRRAGTLRLFHDDTELFTGAVPVGGGAQGGLIAGARWAVTDPRVQRLEPVVLADDFMRQSLDASNNDDPGPWKVSTGTWKLQSAWDTDPHGSANRYNNLIYAQNPFAWRGKAAAGAALCTAGQPFWEDYTLTAAVQPSATGAVGVVVNIRDGGQGILARWSPASSRDPRGNRLMLYQLTGAGPKLLAETRGGYLPNRWYKFTVASINGGVRVAIDGDTKLELAHVTPWRGGIGLYAEGPEGAVFDDVTAYGVGVKQDLLLENTQEQIFQRFQVDQNGMGDWANQQSDWIKSPAGTTMSIHRNDYYGDQWMTLTLMPDRAATGDLWLCLHGNGAGTSAGYRARVSRAADAEKYTYQLYRDDAQLATATGKAFVPWTEHKLRFSHIGKKLTLEVDGEVVVKAEDAKTPAGLRPAYRAEGCFTRVDNPSVLSRNVLDYTFAGAPVDWIGEGNWVTTSRWACSPNWSFLAGWSRGDVVLWHKQRFTGDHALQAFIGLKMEYPREVDIYDFRYRDFAISICGDGRNPRTGYTGYYAATGGETPKRIVLQRNGVEVASVDMTTEAPSRGKHHRHWFELELRKHGATVELYTEGKQSLVFTDPEPIDGGVPAVWAQNNGICVSRARLHFANQPQPRRDTLMSLEMPWYPEWGNVDQPVTVEMTGVSTTADDPLRLAVTPRDVPVGELRAPRVDGLRVTLTPQTTGDHWYAVTATDGKASSPAVHLTLPVFKPTLKRDDSHALVLYRFDEGTGTVVHDRGTGTPADLTITDPTLVHWLPGQGLTQLQAKAPLLKSVAPASKLLGIQQTKAATLECWVSADTIYPANPGGWTGAFLAYHTDTACNFSFGHGAENLIFAPTDVKLNTGTDRLYAWGFRVCLQHVVAAWDGTETTLYVNGNKLVTKKCDWLTSRWNPDASLYLGNQPDGVFGLVGTFYLAAVHDTCLTPEQVLRHYQAGPSAR
jgi:hypothetical protein